MGVAEVEELMGVRSDDASDVAEEDEPSRGERTSGMLPTLCSEGNDEEPLRLSGAPELGLGLRAIALALLGPIIEARCCVASAMLASDMRRVD